MTHLAEVLEVLPAPAATASCLVCGSRNDHQTWRPRCRGCVKAGRCRCLVCRREFGVPRGQKASWTCAGCRGERLIDIAIACRGPEVEGAIRPSTCAGTVRMPVAQVSQRRTFDLASHTYQCASCSRVRQVLTMVAARLTVSGGEATPLQSLEHAREALRGLNRARSSPPRKKTCVVCMRTFQSRPGSRIKRCPDCVDSNRWRVYLRNQRTCIVCGQLFECQPSSRSRRCSQCRTAGRTRCAHCKAEMIVVAGDRPHQACQNCQSEAARRRRRRRGIGRGPFLWLTCKGADLFGERRFARSCLGRAAFLESEARRLRDFDSVGMTYTCWKCALWHQVQHLASRALNAELGTSGRFGEFSQGEAFAYIERMDAVAGVAGRLRTASQVDRVLRIWVEAHRANGTWRQTRPPLKQRGARQDGLKLMTAAWGRDLETIQKRVEVRQCRRCGKLLFAYLSSGRLGSSLHRKCWMEALRTPEARRWLSRRVQLRNRGLSALQINRDCGLHLPVIAIPGRPKLTTGHLTRDFRWAVLMLLRGADPAGLAKQDQVTRPRVYQAVERICALLPIRDLSDQRFARLVPLLESAWGMRRA